MTILREHLLAIATHFRQRRQPLIDSWRMAVTADPKLTTGASLPRAQLQDHIPALLEDYEHRLQADDAASKAAAVAEQKGDAAAHGLHRWQQGFDLSEVTRELGLLNQCVVAEIERYAVAHPEVGLDSMAEARRIWAEICGVAVSSSTSQYFKLQQVEAAGHVADLEQAHETLRLLERERAVLWQQAAHDLRGNLGVVVMATAGLTSARPTEDARAKLLASLDRNVRALHRLLEDVTSLARLQGGQEVRSLAPMDAGRVMREVAEAMQTYADERSLALDFDGPERLDVTGDAIKIRRIVQNLAFNAIKYTRDGGVLVRWGEPGPRDPDRWFVEVQDTGPGFAEGPRAALASVLGVATGLAKDMHEHAKRGEILHADRTETALPSVPAVPSAAYTQPGEGIGLSIVKRLCTLLDATIEFHSEPGQGTTFRVLLPRQYPG